MIGEPEPSDRVENQIVGTPERPTVVALVQAEGVAGREIHLLDSTARETWWLVGMGWRDL